MRPLSSRRATLILAAAFLAGAAVLAVASSASTGAGVEAVGLSPAERASSLASDRMICPSKDQVAQSLADLLGAEKADRNLRLVHLHHLPCVAGQSTPAQTEVELQGTYAALLLSLGRLVDEQPSIRLASVAIERADIKGQVRARLRLVLAGGSASR